MQRSDNFPVCATIEIMCVGGSGRLFISTGFPVKSAIVTPVRIPDGAELVVDTASSEDDGFIVIFSGMPKKATTIKFSYQAL